MPVSRDFLNSLSKSRFSLITKALSMKKVGCVVHLGETSLGRQTYFYCFDLEEGCASLPIAGEPTFDPANKTIVVKGRTFRIDGKEITPCPFELLIHVDLRLYDKRYLKKIADSPFASPMEEEKFLFQCGGGVDVPQRVEQRLGIAQGTKVTWARYLWIRPWELTHPMVQSAIAITAVYPNNTRVTLL